MKRLRSQKGFTLIEIIAVLVILGILAAIAVPKYLDMRKDAVIKAAGGATAELNARERLKLAEWRLKDGQGNYPGPTDTATMGVLPVDTKLGKDWNNDASIISETAILFSGKNVTFKRIGQPNENEPARWEVSVGDS